MSNSKQFDNFIIKRRINIATYCNKLFPSVISKLISEYDYHLEGNSYTLTGHSGPVTCLAMLSDGKTFRLVSGSSDKTIKIWNRDFSKCDLTLRGHTDEVSCMAILSNEPGRIVSGSLDTTFKIWNVHSGLCESTFNNAFSDAYARSDTITKLPDSIDILPNGQILTSSNRIFKIWDIKTGVYELLGIYSFVGVHAVLPDGRIIIYTGYNTLNVYKINFRDNRISTE